MKVNGREWGGKKERNEGRKEGRKEERKKGKEKEIPAE
jgi:hypothetical protein